MFFLLYFDKNMIFMTIIVLSKLFMIMKVSFNKTNN
jgi:hypothetical protein